MYEVVENKISLRRATQEKIWGKMEDMIPFTDIKIRIELDLSNQPTKITYITSLHLYSPHRFLPFQIKRKENLMLLL